MIPTELTSMAGLALLAAIAAAVAMYAGLVRRRAERRPTERRLRDLADLVESLGTDSDQIARRAR
jgi:hypothetical protein